MYANDNYGLCIQALRRFNSKFKPQTSTQMKSVVAALYLAQNDKIFRYAGIIGLLQLDMDRKLKTKFLRIYNMDTMKLAFEIQLYYEFINNYTKLDDKFYHFAYPVGTIGILFRNKQQADIMYAKIKAESPNKKELDQIITQIKAKQKKQQQSHSFFGILKKKIFKKQQEVEQKGEVLKFQKLYSTQIDPEGKFVQSGTSPFQIDIMQRLQLSQKQKKDPQIMQMITTDLIIHQMKKQVMQSQQPQKQIVQLIKQHQKQQKQYLQQCRKTKVMNLPPPPPPPPLLSPNNRISFNKNGRANLMDQIKNNNIRLKHVKTNQKGGVNIDLSKMDTQDRDDFATALRKKIALRNKALNPHPQSDSDDD